MVWKAEELSGGRVSQSGDQGSGRTCSNKSWGNLTSQYMGLVVLTRDPRQCG